MVDGVRLSARLWLPVTTGGEPAPAVLEYIPYRKRDMVRARDERNHPYFAGHGYACVRVDMRGSGDSEGVMTDMYSAEELDDAIEVIDWIASQHWCSGSVGMMGTSWGGTSALQAATRRPDALKAIIAVCATNNRFDDDIHHMGGCLLTDTVEWGATLPAILAAPPDPEIVGPTWRRLWEERLEGLSFPLEDWIQHETRDAYWRWGSANEAPRDIVCPVLLVGGWADRYSNTVMNLLTQGHDRCWGIIGPWGHHYPDVGCPGPAIGFQQEAVRWWDRWLKGAENGVDQEPRLRVWVQSYDPPLDRIEIRSGHWISEPRWPSENIACRDFWLSPARLEPAPSGDSSKAVVHMALGVGSAAGDTGYFGRDGGLPSDQRDDDALSLIFETDPLREPLEILGPARLRVSLESDQPVATLVARLNDVPPSGDVARVTYAVRNLVLDNNGQEPDQLLPNEVRSFIIDFPNVAYRFDREHRIRLALSSSYWPLIWPSPRPTRLTLELASARLALPVRQVTAGVKPAPFAEPLNADNAQVRAITAPPLERWTQTDGDINSRSIGWHQPYKCVRHTAIDLDFAYETSAEHKITLDDPLSAHSRCEHRLHFRRGDWAVEIISIATLTSTETTFKPVGSIEVRENRARVFERQWAPVIHRTCA